MWKLIVTFLVVAAFFHGNSGASEDHILRDLLQTYRTRPVKNNSDTVQVTVDVVLLHVNSLDVNSQVLSVNAYHRMSWRDRDLVWDPQFRGGVRRMHVMSSLIWLPDIVLLNLRGASKLLLDPRAVVSHDGTVVWIPVYQHSAHCNMDLGRYTQECNLKFGSWSYNQKEINLAYGAQKMDLSNLEPNRDWAVQYTAVKRNAISYSCCPGEIFVDLTYSLTLRIKKNTSSALTASSGFTDRPFVVIFVVSLIVGIMV
ncbi:neuronal acetylcholine receptor subunit alpha-6-like [Lingula anatina]|uniref:Neuronal acetylcholine receptor subunit alpha-6-like n=1 Tax=Lingula anatina TaxID=7574 RepID=A0A1S3IG96_LINAN|nr:neuronal acetylcholine receptor subunit alpha-6-like [Lingula anatina]|eukprot:XP_013397242.1 neuronal acetylcholine receptor subunit alpha-6-like [Lingula anatina]